MSNESSMPTASDQFTTKAALENQQQKYICAANVPSRLKKMVYLRKNLVYKHMQRRRSNLETTTHTYAEPTTSEEQSEQWNQAAH